MTALLNRPKTTASSPQGEQAAERRRWIALAVLCLGQLMMVLDATIVNVALPSIQRELHFTQANLTWVIDGYLITFGGLLLLAGRMGDLVGRKKVFLAGLVLFTASSIVCGAAGSQAMLIGARLVQGAGGAVASSVILAIIVTEFPERAEQAKAMGMYAFVSAGGGSIGLLAGGALTQSLSWHWIFFVNVPIGVFAFVLGSALIVENRGIGLSGGVDVLGSILITLATMAGAFAIVKSSEYGLLSARTLGVGGASLALLAGFLVLEGRLENPIMPLRILRLRTLMGSSLVRGLLVTGMFSAFFLGALYLEHVLGYDAIDTGLAFMPLTFAIAAMSMGVSARLVERFGAVATLAGGLVGDHRRTAAPCARGRARELLPGPVPRVPGPRPRRGRLVPAAADDGHGRRPPTGRGPRVGHHQRLRAAVRCDRPGDARHDRDRPHEGAQPQRPSARQRAHRRLPPRLRRRRRMRRGRHPRRVPGAAPARQNPAAGDRRRGAHELRAGRADRAGSMSPAGTRRPIKPKRRLTVQRVRAAGRSRRAGTGAVTEMARSLLRDAREADTRPETRSVARVPPCGRTARCVASSRGCHTRLSSRQFAVRRF